MKLDINPFVSLGPIDLGANRADIRDMLFTRFGSRPTEGAHEFVDAYFDLGFFLHYDKQDVLEAAESFLPANIFYKEQELLGKTKAEALRTFLALGVEAICDPDGIMCVDVGIAIYAPDELVEGVAVFRKGYYDRCASP